MTPSHHPLAVRAPRRVRRGLVALAAVVGLVAGACGGGDDSLAWCRALGRVSTAAAAFDDPATTDLTNVRVELEAALDEAPDEFVPAVARLLDYVRDVDDLLVAGDDLATARRTAERTVDVERLATAIDALDRAAADCGVAPLTLEVGAVG
ncbi:MAG: hypothetical protein D6683_11300 [Actinomyces sp.]|nr:MAG: hypothetical protein D6683_11300 [Actinomyces sp.]